jgi:hypothetical protein
MRARRVIQYRVALYGHGDVYVFASSAASAAYVAMRAAHVSAYDVLSVTID